MGVLDSEDKKIKNYNAMKLMPIMIPINVRKIPILNDFNKFFILTLRFISHNLLTYHYNVKLPLMIMRKKLNLTFFIRALQLINFLYCDLRYLLFC